MRMEDLDPDRSRSEYADATYEDLRWLGVRWQEGPDKGGPFGPYLQSKRRNLYLEVWRKLHQRGFLFACRCSRKDLQFALGAPHEASSQSVSTVEPPEDEPLYPGTCRQSLNYTPQLPGPTRQEMELPDGLNWRFRVPDGEVIEFEDGNLGRQRFVAGEDFGDFVVWRRDGTPSYQLACVTDDSMMHITEVVRGADLLKSTARQILLYRALGIPTPKWFHCRIVLDQYGRRLAKRNAALSLGALRQRGVTPMNILAADLPRSA